MKPAALVMVALFATVSLVAVSSGDHGGAVALPEHPAEACTAPFHVQAAQWDFCWQQDDVRGQGIELNQVYFHGDPVLWKIGFPFSITKYENNLYGPFKDTLGASVGGGQNPGFGRASMAIGADQCPRFLGTGTLVNDQRICIEQRGGPEPAVAIWGRYDIFNYRFVQGYILDARGTMEPFVRLGGQLIDGDIIGSTGTNHFHHLYWRADFDVGAARNDAFQVFLRPDEAWNDWSPYTVLTSGGDSSGSPGFDCSWFRPEHAPPSCEDQEGDGQLIVVDPLADFPEMCRQHVVDRVAGWCSLATEAAMRHHPALFTKWRVADSADTNRWDNARSFETTSLSHHDVPVDGAFTTFDAMVLEHKGASQEVGFNVPPVPVLGDGYLEDYRTPAETITDPVAWFAVHAYHDTRDEEQPTMTYHHVSFLIEPRDFLHENLGEDTYAPAPTVPGLPGGGLEDPCVGPVCVTPPGLPDIPDVPGTEDLEPCIGPVCID